MSHNCPICNKAGLPDYNKIKVVCPQCNSDLKVFLLLNTISNPQKSKIVKYFFLGVSLLSIVFLGLFLKSYFNNKELITSNVILNDSIALIQNTKKKNNEEKEPQAIVDKKDAIIKYVVKKDDYPYKIAEFFYNDGNKYKQIETDNNLIQPYTLKVGQILIIKIPLE